MAEEIRAEMVANVWKIVASVGDDVDPGDAVAILESMKMEIPAITEDGGTVSKIAVSEGDVVQEGDLIAVVEEPGTVVEPGPGVESAAAPEPVAASEKTNRR
ncbi:MAG TPA: biotin/lipoyl-binding carrier protein [Kribbellaceae bacterium]